MVAPLLYFPFQSNLAGQRGDGGIVTATGIGAIRYRDGGVMCEEGTTNLEANPIVAVTMASGWSAQQHTSVSRMTDGLPGKELEYPTYIDLVGDPAFSYPHIRKSTAYPVTVAVGQTYTISAEVWSETARSIRIQADFYTAAFAASGEASASFTYTFAAGETKRISHTFTVANAASVRIITSVGGVGSGVATHIKATAFQIENKSYATTFCPLYIGGVLQPGYSWSGTAHASNSVRTNSYITTTATVGLPRTQGSFILLMRTNRWINGVRHVWWGSGAISTNTNGSTGTIQHTVNGVLMNRAGFSAPYDDKILYAEWGSGLMRSMDGNGVLATQGANDFTSDTWPGGTNLILGNDGGTGSRTINGAIQGFAYFPRPLTAIERSSYIAQMQAGAIDFNLFSPRISSIAQESSNFDVSIVQEGRWT